MIYLNRCFYIKIISQKMEKTISHCTLSSCGFLCELPTTLEGSFSDDA